MREFLLDLLFRGGSPGRSQKLLTPGQQKIPLVYCEVPSVVFVCDVPSDKGPWANEFFSSSFFVFVNSFTEIISVLLNEFF